MRQYMFNKEQRAHMEYLFKIPNSLKCWCGWYLKCECPKCPPDKSREDYYEDKKLKEKLK